MKLSCCSFNLISLTRKSVFRMSPRIIAAKKKTPKKSKTPWRQLRMIHPTFNATASATRQMPRTTKNAMVFRRLVTRIGCQGDCTAERCGVIQEMFDFETCRHCRGRLGAPTEGSQITRKENFRRRPGLSRVQPRKRQRLRDAVALRFLRGESGARGRVCS